MELEYANEVRLFNKYPIEDVNVKDPALKDVMPVGKRPVFVPHTAGRYQRKAFRKIKCPVVERLVNSLMMHGRNNGKKLSVAPFLCVRAPRSDSRGSSLFPPLPRSDFPPGHWLVWFPTSQAAFELLASIQALTICYFLFSVVGGPLRPAPQQGRPDRQAGLRDHQSGHRPEPHPGSG